MNYITLDIFGTKTNITNPFCNIEVESKLFKTISGDSINDPTTSNEFDSRASSPLDLHSDNGLNIDDDYEFVEDCNHFEAEDRKPNTPANSPTSIIEDDENQEDQEDQEDQEENLNDSIDELLDGYDSDDHAIRFGAYYGCHF